MYELYYGITSLLLSVLLFFPVRKFLMAISANRQADKLKRALTEEEFKRIEKRMNITAAIVAVTFAFVFNKILIIKQFGGR